MLIGTVSAACIQLVGQRRIGRVRCAGVDVPDTSVVRIFGHFTGR